MKVNSNQPRIVSGKAKKILILGNFIVAIIYFSWWLIPGHVNNRLLYGLLLFGEIYHLFMAMSFWHTVWPKKVKKNRNTNIGFFPSVDIYITVAGEPVDVVEKTVKAAKCLDYPNHRVYVLNDGFVAKKDNWKVIEELACNLGVNCITRKIPGGAKAGNVNNALKQTSGELVGVFDADMVPHFDFLKKIVPYFKDNTVGFVQSPQYYKNFDTNKITQAAWDQQEFFFGPIMRGKEKSNAAFICGTNFVIRKKTLMEVGGMNEDNIAEDFLTSLQVHRKGWRSLYVDEVLAEGLAPEDMLSYYKQQLRWARGSLEVLFAKNPIFKRDLSWHQKIEYLASTLYYFNGLIVVIDIVMPLLFLYFGIKPVAASSSSFALFFIPFMYLNLSTIRAASGERITFRAISFSQSSWVLQLVALRSVLFGQKMGFSVTSKKALNGNYLHLAIPHIVYVILALAGIFWGIYREGINPSIITNVAWATVNCVFFIPYITAAYKPSEASEDVQYQLAT